MTDRPDHAREVKHLLTDPVRVCAWLKLDRGAQRQSDGLFICCPWHKEKTPSCSVTVGDSRTIRVHCFGCNEGRGSVVDLIAVAHGLDASRDFREVLALGADLGGRTDLATEIRSGETKKDRPLVAPPTGPTKPPKEPMEPGEAFAFWRSCLPLNDDREACRYLVGRRIDPELVAARQLARVLPEGDLPWWASRRDPETKVRYSWPETEHRIVVRVFDAKATLRGIRAWCVVPGVTPKRLPAAGFAHRHLSLQNAAAFRMLRGEQFERVIITEGEPDWMLWSTLTEEPVLGILSGTWSDTYAAAIPDGCRVVIRTHEDAAGERYAAEIAASLRDRPVTILRSAEAA